MQMKRKNVRGKKRMFNLHVKTFLFAIFILPFIERCSIFVQTLVFFSLSCFTLDRYKRPQCVIKTKLKRKFFKMKCLYVFFFGFWQNFFQFSENQEIEYSKLLFFCIATKKFSAMTKIEKKNNNFIKCKTSGKCHR